MTFCQSKCSIINISLKYNTVKRYSSNSFIKYKLKEIRKIRFIEYYLRKKKITRIEKCYIKCYKSIFLYNWLLSLLVCDLLKIIGNILIFIEELSKRRQQKNRKNRKKKYLCSKYTYILHFWKYDLDAYFAFPVV